jgi:hypothetical protein
VPRAYFVQVRRRARASQVFLPCERWIAAVRRPANGQVAFGAYVWDEEAHAFVPHGVNVLTLRDAQIEEIMTFLTPDALQGFGLPAASGPDQGQDPPTALEDRHRRIATGLVGSVGHGHPRPGRRSRHAGTRPGCRSATGTHGPTPSGAPSAVATW